MFVEARRAVARINPPDRSGRLEQQREAEEIAAHEIAAAALNSPDEIASFEPLDSLKRSDTEAPGFPKPVKLRSVASIIIHRSPWGGMDARVNDFFRPQTVRRSKNATLAYLLASLLPASISELPDAKQGWEWNDLAAIWLELGNLPLAEKAVERAEGTGLVDWQGIQRVYDTTWRTWLALKNYERALQAAEHASATVGRATYRLEIARSLIKSARREDALAVISSALNDVPALSNRLQRMQFLREIADARIMAGDVDGARIVVGEMGRLAKQRSIIPADQLLTTAAALNDLGDHPRAAELLNEALSRMPGTHQAVGTGVTLGPITGATLRLADSLKSEIAVELYRAGDTAGFEQVLRRLGDWYPVRTWLDLCEASALGNWSPPPKQACERQAGSEFLLHCAVETAIRGDIDATRRYITALVSAVTGKNLTGKNLIGAIYQLLETARVAWVADQNDFTESVLTAAAKTADDLTDIAKRELAFSEIAALRRELRRNFP